MTLSLGDLLEILKKFPNIICKPISAIDLYYSDGSLTTAIAKLEGPSFSAGVFPDGRCLRLYGVPPKELEEALQVGLREQNIGKGIRD
jgi:hypothetical protein